MHHLIERGWFWIIPFDSHKRSKNPLCSVGLTFDERLYPRPKDMTPEEEFNHYLDQYPAVKRQFEGASKVREWVSTDRIQYSSKQTIGHRWCLMSHAAGFLDPLFSRGLSNTFEVVDALVGRLSLRSRTETSPQSASSTSRGSSRGCSSSTTTSSTARSSRSRTSSCGTRSSGSGVPSSHPAPCG